MKIINYLKKYRKSTDILLLVLFIFNIALLGNSIYSSFNKDFVINVIEHKSNLNDVKDLNYQIESREIHGQLKYRSEKLLDFLFVNKTPHSNLLLYVFTLFVLILLMRIKTRWYHQYFTQKLYSNIDTLGFVATVMFILSRIQEIYSNRLVEKMSKGLLAIDHDSYFLTISIVMMVFSALLKSFAKQGNKLQQEQDLTI